jgi:transposase
MKEKEKTKHIYIGIDVSKATLDLCMLIDNEHIWFKISNTVKAVTACIKQIKKKYNPSSITVCMESTGYYNWACYEVFESTDICVYVVNPLHLKRSIGMTRGKTDIIDAKRIVDFIKLHHTNLRPFIVPRKKIRVIQALVAQRNRLIETRTKLKVPANELIALGDKALYSEILKSSNATIKVIEKQIVLVEDQLNTLIQQDEELNEKFKYITSVQGVGKVLAWCMLIKTNEFKSINNPRKLACYAGVVPFEYQSGTSIHKRPRVSVMADRALKKLLHLAAMRAIQLKGDLQDYYHRKVNEGKNKMLVLNAVRNKIVARVCSVVNNQKTYQINLVLS